MFLLLCFHSEKLIEQMYINKNLKLTDILRFTGGHLIWLTLWAITVTSLFEFLH